MSALRVGHIITGLNTGGAEMMLCKLLSRMNREVFEAEVISLTDIGPIGKKIQALGVPVRALGMRRGVPNPLGVLRLACWLRKGRPQIIQTWMYHADLIGGLASRLAAGSAVVWGIHHSNLEPQGSRRTTIWTARACARLSHWLPARIVCCSEASRRVHTGLGYAADKMMVILNGFDLQVYRPDPAARLSVRQELGIPEEAPLIGLVGRFDPQKDHGNFVQAAARLHAGLPEVHFLLCGDGVTWENPHLARWIEAAGIGGRCHLLGRREDIPRLNAAVDISTCSSSFGEGFPMVIGEAMACGVPCVVTDVGDLALVVGETGIVVPPRDPQALADGWRELMEMGVEKRRALGERARKRVEDHYSLARVVREYEALYKQLFESAKGHIKYAMKSQA
jgi:glycosyltransferase involved in cell wall biosynthesis